MQLFRRCAQTRDLAALARPHLYRHAILRPNRRPFRTSALRRKNPLDDDDNVNVRYWEQYGPRKTDVREVAVQSDEELQQKVEALQTEVKQLRQKLGPDEEFDDFLDEMDVPGPEKDGLEADADEALDEFTVDFKLPRALGVYLRDFNRLVRAVAKDFQDGTLQRRRQQTLWLQYLRCKRSIPNFVEQIPEAAWAVVWESQYTLPSADKDRSKHLWALIDDIHQSGLELSPAQKLIQVERLFVEKDYKHALDLWERYQSELQADEVTSEAFLDLGVRLLVASQQLEAAQHLAMDAAKEADQVKAERLAPLIAGWAGKGDDSSIKVAWSFYLYMREQKGAKITLEDFDQVIMAFLNCQCLNLALAVFRDMMLFGKNSPFDSVAFMRKAKGLHKELQDESGSLADLTNVSLTAMACLPYHFRNRYFFASWMKRLIGMGETEAAVQVLRLMFEHGVQPDAKHINGIVAAYLRDGDGGQRDFAIQVGWSMVKQRLKFVGRRHASVSGQPPLDLDVPDLGLTVPPYISTLLPAATIETFSILLHHYERRDMQATIQRIPDILRRAEIEPNAYFMNHLIYSRLRQGDTKGAWRLFDTQTQTVRPNLESFAALWDCQKATLGWRGIGVSPNFPAPRTLFSHMMSWFAGLPPRAQVEAREEFTMDLYSQVVRCVCLSRDVEGTLVALHALRDAFGAHPDAGTVRLVTIQLARLSEPTVTKRQRRAPFRAASAGQKRLQNVMRLFESVTRKREAAIVAAGRDPEGLEPGESKEEELYRLNVLLRMILRSREAELDKEEKLDRRVEEVAFAMGAGALDMGEPRHSRRQI